MVAIIVIDSSVVGATVVAGIVVVTIDKLAVVPRPVAGMALPSPLLVHGDGIGIVAVTGLAELEVLPS